MRRGRPGCSRRASSARSTHAVLPQPVGTSTASGMSPATSLAWSRSCQGQGSWPATSRKCATALPSPCRRALIAPCSSAVAGPRYAPLGPPRRRADSLRALPAVAPDAPLLQSSFISGFLLPVRLVLLSSPALDSARVGGASSVGVPPRLQRAMVGAAGRLRTARPPRRRADSLRALHAAPPDAPLLQASFISGFLLPVRLVFPSSPALDSARVGGASSVGVPRGCSARWWVRPSYLGGYGIACHRIWRRCSGFGRDGIVAPDHSQGARGAGIGRRLLFPVLARGIPT